MDHEKRIGECTISGCAAELQAKSLQRWLRCDLQDLGFGCDPQASPCSPLWNCEQGSRSASALRPAFEMAQTGVRIWISLGPRMTNSAAAGPENDGWSRSFQNIAFGTSRTVPLPAVPRLLNRTV